MPRSSRPSGGRPPRKPRTTNPSAKIEALTARVSEMEQYVASLTRDSYDAILGVDKDGTIRSWNRGAWVIFGWEPEEVVGKSYHHMFPPELDADAEFGRMQKLLERRGYANDEEVVRMTRDGRRVILSVTRTALKNAGGEYVGFSAIMRDITERKRLEARLIHSERMTALGELAAVLAHEIKNPLNSMVINLEVLRGHLAGLDPDNRAKTEKYMRVLTDEMQRLNKVIRGFLDFAKPVALTFRDLSLNDVLRDLLDLIEPQARKNSVVVVRAFDEDLPLVNGDPAQLKQALLNLVLNALHAMPDGGTLTLSTSTLPQRFVRATVRDTGHGIPPETKSKVFDLFYTTKPDGSGLGLPTVQRIVESHGGRIDVESTPHEGTAFHLVFPGL